MKFFLAYETPSGRYDRFSRWPPPKIRRKLVIDCDCMALGVNCDMLSDQSSLVVNM